MTHGTVFPLPVVCDVSPGAYILVSGVSCWIGICPLPCSGKAHLDTLSVIEYTTCHNSAAVLYSTSWDVMPDSDSAAQYDAMTLMVCSTLLVPGWHTQGVAWQWEIARTVWVQTQYSGRCICWLFQYFYVTNYGEHVMLNCLKLSSSGLLSQCETTRL